MSSLQNRRFMGVPPLKAALTELVLEQPEAVMALPDAVELLITPVSVATSHKALKTLSFWSPARMHTILYLLSRCNQDVNMKAPMAAHPAVAAYVARSLKSFDTAALMFVLPQLVQALRHDLGGATGQLLADLSGRSALLSHQLMWVLNSECKAGGEDKHGPAVVASPSDGVVGGSGSPTVSETAGKDAIAMGRHGFQSQLKGVDTLPAAATALRDTISASFTGPSRRLFDVEYTFFDRITDISGILKRDVHDPLLRRPKIKEALKDIRIKAELDAAKQKWRDEDVAMHVSKPSSGGGKDADVGAKSILSTQSVAGSVGLQRQEASSSPVIVGESPAVKPESGGGEPSLKVALSPNAGGTALSEPFDLGTVDMDTHHSGMDGVVAHCLLIAVITDVVQAPLLVLHICWVGSNHCRNKRFLVCTCPLLPIIAWSLWMWTAAGRCNPLPSVRSCSPSLSHRSKVPMQR
jgi:Phosphoinositide 3-kinase family, accessory domain (PIK domain)